MKATSLFLAMVLVLASVVTADTYLPTDGMRMKWFPKDANGNTVNYHLACPQCGPVDDAVETYVFWAILRTSGWDENPTHGPTDFYIDEAFATERLFELCNIDSVVGRTQMLPRNLVGGNDTVRVWACIIEISADSDSLNMGGSSAGTWGPKWTIHYETASGWG